jgi:hypothetical protein
VTKFQVGRLVATPGAKEAIEKSGASFWEYLARHRSGDYGVMPPEDKRTNDRAIVDGDRIFSAYDLPDGTRIWLITEADRSVTTFLLPDEY